MPAKRKNQNIDEDELPTGPTPLEVMSEHDNDGNYTFRDHTLEKDDERRNAEEAVATVPTFGRIAVGGAQVTGSKVPRVKVNHA